MPSFDAAARAVEMALGRREEVPVAKSERFGSKVKTNKKYTERTGSI